MDNNIYLITLSEDRRSLNTETINIPQKGLEILLLNLKQSTRITASILKEIGLSELTNQISYKVGRGATRTLKKLNNNDELQDYDIRERIKGICINNALSSIDERKYIDIIIGYSNYTFRMKELTRELSLYYDFIDRITDSSKDNELISLGEDCSSINNFILSTDIMIDGRPYIKINVSLSNTIRIWCVQSVYELPKWSIQINKSDNLIIHKDRECFDSNNKSTQDIIELLFSVPEDFHIKSLKIIESFKNIFSVNINVDDILFDWCRNCYCLKEEKEISILSDLAITKSEDIEFCKYTSLSTLISTLNSGYIRLNSIIAMNDKTETSFLSDISRNYKEPIENDDDKYFLANKKFITSFTTRRDELDMWRFYGDNARGACMVFEKINDTPSPIKKVIYVGSENQTINMMNKLLSDVLKISINFRFRLFSNNNPFYKPIDFVSEKENRLLIESKTAKNWYINSENGIITPYIERKLIYSNKKIIDIDDFPLKLKTIILGPEMRQVNINKVQIESILQSKYGYNITVETSAITSYR